MILTAILLMSSITSGADVPRGHYLIDDNVPQVAAPIEEDARLPSNSVIDIVQFGDSLWLGTGRGLAELHLDVPGGGWSVMDEGDGLGKGGVSALAVTDSVIWVATAYSKDTDYGLKPAGGGVGYSRDSGVTWHWQKQPVDDRNETDFKPTTTNIQNLTYDFALSNTAVWIVSYGGGLRKLPYGEDEWINRPPDDKPFWAKEHLNHRCFSAVFHDSLLYIGTADGVNRSTDEGETWTHFYHEINNPGTISGNFVTALAVQKTNLGYNLWAATWRAERSTEHYGISVSSNKGDSWRIVLCDTTTMPDDSLLIDKYGQLKVHNFGFKGETVYAAADGGLWKSTDSGNSWGEGPWLQTIEDPSVGLSFEELDFYSVTPVGDSLWVGTDEGLFVGWWDRETLEYVWRVHRAYQPVGVGGEPDSYAYPNPFSPVRGVITNIQVPAYGQTYVKYTIFNFAMEKVFKSATFLLPGGGKGDMKGYGSVSWDGRDDARRIVANGVYFYRIQVDDKTWWGKVMVLD